MVWICLGYDDSQFPGLFLVELPWNSLQCGRVGLSHAPATDARPSSWESDSEVHITWLTRVRSGIKTIIHGYSWFCKPTYSWASPCSQKTMGLWWFVRGLNNCLGLLRIAIIVHRHDAQERSREALGGCSSNWRAGCSTLAGTNSGSFFWVNYNDLTATSL